MKPRAIGAFAVGLVVASGCGDDESPRPERFVVSDDGDAVLWVPEGSAPAGVDIRITRVERGDDSGYALEPSGLVFTTPAGLFVRLPPTEDGQRWVSSATLESEGGERESLQTFALGAEVVGGVEETWLATPIPHFSRVWLRETMPGGPAAGRDAVVFLGPVAPKLVGATWETPIVVTPQVNGNYVVRAEATGAIRLRAPVRAEWVAFGQFSPQLTPLPLECAQEGPGKIEVQLHTVAEGRGPTTAWIQRDVQCVPPLNPPPAPSAAPASVGHALQESLTELAAETKETLRSGIGGLELMYVSNKLAEILGSAARYPSLSLTLDGSCTDGCTLDVAHDATATLGVTGSALGATTSHLLLSPSQHVEIRYDGPTDQLTPIQSSVEAGTIVARAPFVPTGQSQTLAFKYVCKAPGTHAIGALYRVRGEFTGGEFTGSSWPVLLERPTVLNFRCAGASTACTPQDPKLTALAQLAAFFGVVEPHLACVLPSLPSLTQWSGSGVPPKAPGNFTRLLRRGALVTTLAQALLDARFNNSDFPCGAGPNGFTLCPSPVQPLVEGSYLMLYATVQDPIPLTDATNHFQYGFVFDADGNPSNNYVPAAAYPNDFFKGTDRWYAAEYSPAAGWSLKVTDASGGSTSSATSMARVILRDDTILLVVPASEFSVPAPSYRTTLFRHTGDYGANAPHDWDGAVDPPVASGLHPFPQ
ncbi:MAG: hypothetical protein KIT84_20290 [Labilithrix sp.]|nr:hypothetical protein [Labilithrix sp.]MCW5813380.1 hypothetical protein [Labilithrix sp.]